MKKLLLVLVMCIAVVGAACAGAPKAAVSDPEVSPPNTVATADSMSDQDLADFIVQVVQGMNLQGDQGPKGDTGAQGVQGIQGTKGDPGNSTLPTPTKFTLDPTSGYDAYSEKLAAGDLVVVNTIDMGMSVAAENGAKANWVSVWVCGEVPFRTSLSYYSQTFTPQVLDYGAGWVSMGFGFVILVPFDGTYRFELTVDQTKGPPVPVPVTIYHLAQLWQ
jgi:hypothetical protein